MSVTSSDSEDGDQGALPGYRTLGGDDEVAVLVADGVEADQEVSLG